MKRLTRIGLTGVLLWPLLTPGAELPAITVIETDAAQAVIPAALAGVVTHRYNLDALKAAESALNASLPADPALARAKAGKRAKSSGSALQEGWAGLMSMALWQIEYTPAIVFGKGEAVWYGPHLEAAIAAWRKREAGHD